MSGHGITGPGRERVHPGLRVAPAGVHALFIPAANRGKSVHNIRKERLTSNGSVVHRFESEPDHAVARAWSARSTGCCRSGDVGLTRKLRHYRSASAAPLRPALDAEIYAVAQERYAFFHQQPALFPPGSAPRGEGNLPPGVDHAVPRNVISRWQSVEGIPDEAGMAGAAGQRCYAPIRGHPPARDPGYNLPYPVIRNPRHR